MTPIAYQSLAGEAGLPAACSGAIVAGVPSRPSSPPSATSSAARPKSRMTTRPSAVTSTFDDLRSRCSLPAACRALTPAASCSKAGRRRSGGGAAPVLSDMP
ncbi:hypothetical protein OV079_14860 [Nannocystis pusilla]|uniref:Uncharacterized protein n=1 Tax=Nannocystis pusilla TaxID=889268 RepID=A0A9X3IXR8_9BACT|nr:hypothetical protein [Nannocystis pusilla]MCY1006809.1 hypothetical protein [Nannocystis pusilla]